MDDETNPSPIRFSDKQRASSAQLWVSDGRIHCTNVFGDAFDGAEAMTYMRSALDGRRVRPS